MTGYLETNDLEQAKLATLALELTRNWETGSLKESSEVQKELQRNGITAEIRVIEACRTALTGLMKSAVYSGANLYPDAIRNILVSSANRIAKKIKPRRPKKRGDLQILYDSMIGRIQPKKTEARQTRKSAVEMMVKKVVEGIIADPGGFPATIAPRSPAYHIVRTIWNILNGVPSAPGTHYLVAVKKFLDAHPEIKPILSIKLKTFERAMARRRKEYRERVKGKRRKATKRRPRP
jgi:hypothetical protein